DESIPVALVCPLAGDVDTVASGTAEVIRYPVFELPFTEHLNRKILIEQLAEFKPAVLHCLCESNASLTMHLAEQLGLPYVLTVNSLRKHWGRLPISQWCAGIIVPAKSIAESVAKTYPHFADRIRQINIGTFVQERSNCFSNPSRLASVVVVPAEGRLDNVDDFENLFNAVRSLMIEQYEFMVVVVGEGRAEMQLRKLLAALGLLQIVTIVGRLRPWHSVFAAGDIFIQPQPTSAFNPLLVEAMGVGAAVAACKGGVDDLIIENQTAVVFDPNDELSIKSTLKTLFDRREFARKIAQGAQKFLRENHTVSEMISATWQTYDDAGSWRRSH
ncbi:MAG: glycosyltransferase, partial [Planctomycetota bacterium]|nr:glycosyltransferase [Planctomycetota bacterium]